MARLNKIINIGISWTGFLLAVLLSSVVSLALLWIKRNHKQAQTTESFQQTAAPSISYKELNSIFGPVKALSLCKSAKSETKAETTETLKIKKKLQVLPCGAIIGRDKKPRTAQAALAMLLIAQQFVNIFNYNGDTIENNKLHRKDFIDLIVSQCYASGEAAFQDIRTELSNITQLTEDMALDILNKYPCVRSNCESMVRRIYKANAGTIGPIIDPTYSIVQTGNSVSSQPVSMQPAQQSTNETSNQIKLDTEYVKLAATMNEISNFDCEPIEKCLMSIAAEEDVELSEAMDTLAKSYPSGIAINMLLTSNELLSKPENKTIINMDMEPVSNSETIGNRTPTYSPSDFSKCFSYNNI